MYEMDIVNQLKTEGYPYYFDDHDFGGSTIFFQTEEMRNRYITERENANSREEMLITGKYLGFPSIACEFFVNAYDNPELKTKRATYRYYGYQFAGSVDDRHVIAKWLWENVKAPIAAVEVKYKDEIKLIEPSVVTV